eukprot:TRINITY_DN35823_c1_g1_i1.p1 TRINITY_DN35823_c1_g1~~TRINITY_DN35823_c1_g1_i1.p1  ORF type:complete len:341 (-),score=80.03 TRINITY_DN35823_c1_g1_i1:88-1032(-)
MATLVADFDTAHCGAILDAQLDGMAGRLATASADGHIRLWDVAKPEEPHFLADLGAHAGAVSQVAWAPPATGAGGLLASAGSDGRLILWGPGVAQDAWKIVHEENLQKHGALRAVAWGPPVFGAVLATASGDGSIATIHHQGTVRSGESEIEHRWLCQSLPGHKGQANAVSWADAVGTASSHGILAGARLASAGDDGLRVWRREADGRWQEEPKEEVTGLKLPMRDVSFMPYDGIQELLATACGKQVVFWCCDGGRWKVNRRLDLKKEVWKLEWAEVGRQLLVSCGHEEQQTVMLKQRLNGEWDIIEIGEAESS